MILHLNSNGWFANSWKAFSLILSLSLSYVCFSQSKCVLSSLPPAIKDPLGPIQLIIRNRIRAGKRRESEKYVEKGTLRWCIKLRFLTSYGLTFQQKCSWRNVWPHFYRCVRFSYLAKLALKSATTTKWLVFSASVSKLFLVLQRVYASANLWLALIIGWRLSVNSDWHLERNSTQKSFHSWSDRLLPVPKVIQIRLLLWSFLRVFLWTCKWRSELGMLILERQEKLFNNWLSKKI